MSIATEITRLKNAKSEIKKALQRKGIVVSDSDTLDEYAAVIDPMTQGKDITYFDNPNGYLSFKYIGGGTFRWRKNSSFNVSLLYSKDAGATWSTIRPDHQAIVVSDGDEIWVKGTGSTLSTSTDNYGYFYTTAKRIYVSGNVNSLVNFETASSYCFFRLFKDNCYLDISKEKQFSLPAMALADYCYYEMFKGCKSLTIAPELSATTLATNCYSFMFQNCTSLTTAPLLPATTLAPYCYQYMFNGCTSLTTVPSLLATTLADYCCQYMFSGCILLTTAPELSATTLANNCCRYMFSGCTSLTTATK